MEGRGVLRSPAAASDATPAVSVSTLLERLIGTPGAVRRGAVLSVHRSAVNIMVDGALVTIASARGGGLPNGVLVDEPFEPHLRGVRAGMAVAISDAELTIDAGRVRVRLGAAPRWRPELRPTGSPPDLDLRVRVARSEVHLGGEPGIVSVAEPLAALAAAMSGGSQAGIVEAGRHLVGLGVGLTPAGDDILVGLTAALTALGDERGRVLARAWARHAMGRSTVVAESFHRHAAAAAYSQRLHDVLDAILVGPVADIPPAVRTAAAWGATSGRDTLAGILLALDAALVATEHEAA